MKTIHLNESEDLRWFEELPKCRCGKTAEGILRGSRNDSYGYHCRKCAQKRLRDSEAARNLIAKAAAQ